MIIIHKWNVVMEIRPHMKMGDNILLFMYEGVAGLFLFISWRGFVMKIVSYAFRKDLSVIIVCVAFYVQWNAP